MKKGNTCPECREAALEEIQVESDFSPGTLAALDDYYAARNLPSLPIGKFYRECVGCGWRSHYYDKSGEIDGSQAKDEKERIYA